MNPETQIVKAALEALDKKIVEVNKMIKVEKEALTFIQAKLDGLKMLHTELENLRQYLITNSQ